LSEATLTHRFEASFQDVPGFSDGVLLSEVDTGEGIPDFVFVRALGLERHQLMHLLAELPAAAFLNGTGAVLAELQQRPHTLEYLAKRTGLSRAHADRSARSLSKIGWVSRTTTGCYYLNGQPFPEIEITAFEFKLKDVRRAVQQATRYKHFAQRSLVVLPVGRETSGRAVAQLASQALLGIAIFDSVDCVVRYVVRPVKTPARSRHAYMHVLGRILQHMELGDRTSERRFPRQLAPREAVQQDPLIGLRDKASNREQ